MNHIHVLEIEDQWTAEPVLQQVRRCANLGVAVDVAFAAARLRKLEKDRQMA